MQYTSIIGIALAISLAAAQATVNCVNGAGTVGGDLPPATKVAGGFLLDGVTFFTLANACNQACSDQYV
jgi:hypothetical protein